MVAFQEILGKQQAEQFTTSLDAVVSHLEARQRQIIAALQETSTTLEVFKRLSSGNSAQTVTPITLAAIAQLEQAVVPKLEAIAEPVAPQAESFPTAEASPTESAVETAIETEPEIETEIEAESELEPEPEVSEPPPQAKRTKTPKAAPKTSKKTNTKGSSKGKAAQKYATFHPRRSVLKEFEGKTLRDAIKIILTRRANEAFTINDVMDALYGNTISPESFKVAKSVVVVELSKGKLTKQWSSVPGQRGVYMFSTAVQ